MRSAALTAVLAAALCLSPVFAQAAPEDARVVTVADVGERLQTVTVYSPAMNREIPLTVIRAAAAGRPTLYLLNGSQGGPNGSGWDAQTDAVGFLRDRDVNAVIPMGGAGSYYTDWIRDDAVLGRNKWQTFLNEELPPVIEAYLNADGARALAGVSMSGTSVLNLAIAAPGFWRGVASFSGCAQTSDPLGQEYIRVTVENWSGAQSVENMWGPRTDPRWRANDPLVNAAGLRGTAVYLSTGTGVPAAPHDTPADPRVRDGRIPLPVQIAFGGPIEAAVHSCTLALASRLRELDIPATVNERPAGTHSWGYWEDDLHSAWPFLAGVLGTN